LAQAGAINVGEHTQRRFDIELFIVHRSLDPSQITAALGVGPTKVHGIGDACATPSGFRLSGTNRDTRWRYSVRYEVEDQWFAEKITELVDRLMPHAEFFRQVRSTGGSASIIVQFLGDGYFGDEIPRETLQKLADLGFNLAIECFQVPQSRYRTNTTEKSS
jgi:hypothetical protein